MLKIFSILQRSGKPAPESGGVPDWIRDPLAHPDIEAMDSRALGDLPFRAFPVAREGQCRVV